MTQAHQKSEGLSMQLMCVSNILRILPRVPGYAIKPNSVHVTVDMYCLFDLILYIPSTIFQLCRDASSWVEPVLS